jgi:hypothetical protein
LETNFARPFRGLFSVSPRSRQRFRSLEIVDLLISAYRSENTSFTWLYTLKKDFILYRSFKDFNHEFFLNDLQSVNFENQIADDDVNRAYSINVALREVLTIRFSTLSPLLETNFARPFRGLFSVSPRSRQHFRSCGILNL